MFPLLGAPLSWTLQIWIRHLNLRQRRPYVFRLVSDWAWHTSKPQLPSLLFSDWLPQASLKTRKHLSIITSVNVYIYIWLYCNVLYILLVSIDIIFYFHHQYYHLIYYVYIYKYIHIYIVQFLSTVRTHMHYHLADSVLLSIWTWTRW